MEFLQFIELELQLLVSVLFVYFLFVTVVQQLQLLVFVVFLFVAFLLFTIVQQSILL